MKSVRFVLLVVFALLTLLWTGCGGDSSSPVAAAPAPVPQAPAPPPPPPAPTPTPIPSNPPATPLTILQSSFGNQCKGTLEVNATGENGGGSFSVRDLSPTTTYQLSFNAFFLSASVPPLAITQFTTDAAGAASGTFKMSPGVYSGNFSAAAADTSNTTAKTGSDNYCESVPNSFYNASLVRSSSVTFGKPMDDSMTSVKVGTDPLSWGRVLVTVNSSGHPIMKLEIHGAKPNTTYDITHGRLSCGYAAGQVITNVNGDGSLFDKDLFGECPLGFTMQNSDGYQFQTGFIVK